MAALVSRFRYLSPLRHRLTIALLATALLARLLVPAGWMPVADAAGTRLAPCDGMTMATASAIPHDGDRTPMHHQGATDHPCAFAGPTATPDVPVLAMPMPFPAAALSPTVARRLVAVGRGLAAPPPPQTGPPAFA